MKSLRYLLNFFVLMTMIVSCKTVPLSSVSRDADFGQYLFKKSRAYSSKYFSTEQLDIKVISDDTKNLRGKVNIMQGEYIYANINILGFELGRLELSVDSVKFINRIEKSYYFGEFSKVEGLLGIDLSYSQIESIILKGFVVDGSENRKLFKSRLNEGQEGFTYTYRSSFGAEVVSGFDIGSYNISSLDISDSKAGLFLSVFPGIYYEDPNYPRDLKVMVRSKSMDAEVQLQVGKISLDKFSRKNFNVNSSYSEILF